MSYVTRQDEQLLLLLLPPAAFHLLVLVQPGQQHPQQQHRHILRAPQRQQAQLRRQQQQQPQLLLLLLWCRPSPRASRTLLRGRLFKAMLLLGGTCRGLICAVLCSRWVRFDLSTPATPQRVFCERAQ
jgi:hypothetical protein